MRGRGSIADHALAALSMGLMIVGGFGAARESLAAKMRPVPTGKTYAWDFQADTLGQGPAHSVAFGGVWQVTEDSTGSSPGASVGVGSSADSTRATFPMRRLLRQSEGDDGISYHYLMFTRPQLGDLDAAVRFRIRSGEIDPSAGLLFQMDSKGTSGYLVRISGKSGELGFHYLLYGRRRDVKYARVARLEPGSWHTIAISRRRSVLRAFYDGQEVMVVRDDRFSKGSVGIWTENDTVADFAGLTATAR
jgi:hypothetical protein